MDFDVVVGGDGKRSILPGFDRKEFRGKLALAITANFVNYFTQEESAVEEISGVARIFNQKFFKELNEELGIDLENIVYYRNETHYFVMTAKKRSLLSKGVLREVGGVGEWRGGEAEGVMWFRASMIVQDNPDVRQLLAPSNIDREQLYQFSYEAASWSTALPRLNFAVRNGGRGGEGRGGRRGRGEVVLPTYTSGWGGEGWYHLNKLEG